MTQHRYAQYSTKSRQNGVVLITALVLLMTMTLLGTTAMRTTTLDERMAGNFRDRSLAFQAAEAALREGEAAAMAPEPAVIGRIGNSSDPEAYDWTNAQIYSGTLDGVSEAPRYVIEELFAEDDGSGEIGKTREAGAIDSAGSPSAGSTDGQEGTLYRITAMGRGGTTAAVVILQSTVSVD